MPVGTYRVQSPRFPKIVCRDQHFIASSSLALI